MICRPAILFALVLGTSFAGAEGGVLYDFKNMPVEPPPTIEAPAGPEAAPTTDKQIIGEPEVTNDTAVPPDQEEPAVEEQEQSTDQSSIIQAYPDRLIIYGGPSAHVVGIFLSTPMRVSYAELRDAEYRRQQSMPYAEHEPN